MFRRIATTIGTVVLFLSLAPDARAQRRTQPTPARGQRPGAEHPRTSVRLSGPMPDLRCQIYISDNSKAPVEPIPNGSEIEWGKERGGLWGMQGVKPQFHVHATVFNDSEAKIPKVLTRITVTNNDVEMPTSPKAAEWVSLGPKSGPEPSGKQFGPYTIGPLADGNYNIAAKMLIDVGDLVNESNESNNKCEWTLAIRQKTPKHNTSVTPEILQVPRHGYLIITESKAVAPNRRCEGSPNHCPPSPPVFPDWAIVKVKNASKSEASAVFHIDADVNGCHPDFVLKGPSLAPGEEVMLKHIFGLNHRFAGCTATSVDSDGRTRDVRPSIRFQIRGYEKDDCRLYESDHCPYDHAEVEYPLSQADWLPPK